jgi:uncharacterized protein (TIGR02246 family)
MRRFLLLALLVGSWTWAGVEAKAQPGKDEAAIRAVIAAQTEAWNRGDIPAFMEAYEHSPETTFIGSNIGKGYEKILERYQKNYSNREQMGTLTFSDIEVRMLSGSQGKTEFAIVTGRFHLERSQKGESKKDDGVFSLVWRKGPQGWKIVLDHTS